MDRRPDPHSGERGQALPLFVLMLIALLAATGLVVDVGAAWAQERSQQKVADMASLAAATQEANGGGRTAMINAARASALANGFAASEVEVNIPPTEGRYAPGAGKDAMLANDCSSAAQYPCWIEVKINRQRDNWFAGIVGQGSWDVSARGVAVGGIANSVSNGLAPLMFHETAVTNSSLTQFCNPQDHKCTPNNDFPIDNGQFNWTTVCITDGNCNVNTQDTVNMIEAGLFSKTVVSGMDLGAHNVGQHTAACEALMAEFPNGTTFPVVINDDNGNLVGFWMFTFDPATTECQGTDGMTLGGSFSPSDETPFGRFPLGDTPLTINAGGPVGTFGLYVVKLVE